MFVIKATLKDETRRLVFDRSGFPQYSEVQQKVSGSLLNDGFVTSETRKANGSYIPSYQR